SFERPMDPRGTRPDELERMQRAAEKAIHLDPLLAEAHSALGVAYARNGQWKQAEMSLRHAIEIAPNASDTHYNLTRFFLWPLGSVQDAVREARTTVKLDRLSPQAHYMLSETLLSAGRYDEAAGQCEKLPADFAFTNECLGRVRLHQGRVADAIKVMATSV